MKNSKKIILILSFLIVNCILIIDNSPAQWITQSSGTLNPIRDIHFVNDTTGFFCGTGIIGKTTNGGQNWILLNHPATNKSLYSINPIDENNIYCVGWFETILKSTDGGSSWIEIRNGPVGQGSSYFASQFINSQTGWIAGSGQKVFKTTDGGATLDSIYLFTGYTRDIYFKDELNGILCGEGGAVYKTTNGGINWYRPNIQLHGNLYNFYQLSVVNDSLVWLIGNINPVYRSTDFGENWDSIGYVTGSDETYDVNFTSDLTGYCGGTFGRFFKTTNGGYTWNQENTKYFDGYYSNSYFLNDTVGWICGNGGRIQFTDSGGETLVNITNLFNEIPDGFTLKQNYPNPFNAQTTIEFNIPKRGIYKLEVFSILGRKELEIFNEIFSPGSYSVNLDMNNFSSGTYIYRLGGNSNFLSGRLMLIK